MSVYHVVQCALWLLQCLLKIDPGRLDDFEKDVMLKLIDKMHHFGHSAAGFLPVLAELVIYSAKYATSSRHTPTPG